MHAVATLLTAFERHVAAGRRASAYRAVRDAWQQRRAEPLAKLVEQAARRLGQPEPLAGKTQKARHLAWIERARGNDPLDLPLLFAELAQPVAASRATAVAARLDELFEHPNDPALTDALAALLWEPGGTSSWGKVQTRLFKLLEATGDPRAIARLDALLEHALAHPNVRPPSVQRSVIERTPLVRARLADRFPDGVPTIDPALVERIAQLSALLDAPLPAESDESAPQPPTEELLLGAILLDPDDDESRAVYADLLQERGDPRGQFIALQLAAAEPTPAGAAANKRAKALLSKHRKAWLGPLAQVVTTSSAVFERGFLAECTTEVRRKVLADTAFALPEWGTVKRLTFERFGHLSPAMTALEEAYGVPESGLEQLSETAFPRLRVLEVNPNASRSARDPLDDGAPRGKGLLALIDPKGLPALRELRLNFKPREWHGEFRLRGPGDYAWLFERPIGRQLERLVVNVEDPTREIEPLAAWVVQFGSTDQPPRTIVLRVSNVQIVLTRADGQVAAGVVFSDVAGDALPARAARQLESLHRAIAGAAVQWRGWIRE